MRINNNFSARGRMRMYDQRTEELLRLLPPMTRREWERLSLACADQAGMDVNDQVELTAMFEHRQEAAS